VADEGVGLPGGSERTHEPGVGRVAHAQPARIAFQEHHWDAGLAQRFREATVGGCLVGIEFVGSKCDRGRE